MFSIESPFSKRRVCVLRKRAEGWSFHCLWGVFRVSGEKPPLRQKKNIRLFEIRTYSASFLEFFMIKIRLYFPKFNHGIIISRKQAVVNILLVEFGIILVDFLFNLAFKNQSFYDFNFIVSKKSKRFVEF